MSQPLASNCILWDGPRRADGYGRVHIDGKRPYAHRVAYCRAHSIPLSEIDGLVIRHRCDNPQCVNPDHLETGTHADNIADQVARDRNASRERHGHSKLTEQQVAEIRNADTSVRGRKSELARTYDVSCALITRILQGRIWKPIKAPIKDTSGQISAAGF